MSMYSIESNRKGSEVSSRRSPTLIEVQIPEEVHSSPPTKNILRVTILKKYLKHLPSISVRRRLVGRESIIKSRMMEL